MSARACPECGAPLKRKGSRCRACYFAGLRRDDERKAAELVAFREAGMGNAAIARRIGRSLRTVDSLVLRLRRAGFAIPAAPRSPPRQRSRPRAYKAWGKAKPAMVAVPVLSEARSAMRYLQPYGPVSPCDAAGEYSERGSHYRIDGKVVDAAELIARAVRKGWTA